MARRTELRGICHDMLLAFSSRNNDLRGYWALGQLKSWIEDEGEGALIIPLMGEASAKSILQFAEVSCRFVAMLNTLIANYRLLPDWVVDARITIELTASNQVKCSIIVVSDLGRSFEATRTVLARRHDPRWEQRTTRIGVL
ncbi:MAG: hypothetical protein JWS10_3868 [Cypionkella sp.]|uniref:hypothetical protein n=1 Tax=Cypionkella sp. TaxID=2811411 RepID=UPI00261BBE7B|nr:hypothetical protein [Cypionkella sp.]MDB5661253.1 hypothetical protein [Cypionkella sp.]